MNLKGGAALVTGSATGTGRSAAIQFAERGCNVVVNYSRSKDKAEETAHECEQKGVEAIVMKVDVTSDDECRAMAKAAMDKWGRIDALVCSAGTTKFVPHSDLEGLSGEDFLHIFNVNLVGIYQMVRAVTEPMRAGDGGAIVNISSIAGVRGGGSSIAYAASKGALNVITQSLARVLAPKIRINALCPGFIEGRWLMEGLGEARYNAQRENWINNTPLHITSTADDVAAAALWLIEGAKHMTGQSIVVDDGETLGGSQLSRR